MPDHSHTLTDDEIRKRLDFQAAQILKLGLEILVLQRALLDSKILTEADLAQARIQVDAEVKKAQNFLDPTNLGPSGNVQ